MFLEYKCYVNGFFDLRQEVKIFWERLYTVTDLVYALSEFGTI